MSPLQQGQCISKNGREGVQDHRHQPECRQSLANFKTFVPAGNQVGAP